MLEEKNKELNMLRARTEAAPSPGPENWAREEADHWQKKLAKLEEEYKDLEDDKNEGWRLAEESGALVYRAREERDRLRGLHRLAEEEARSRPATTSSASSKLFARTNAATRELNVSSVARMPWRSMRARTRRRRSVSRTTP